MKKNKNCEIILTDQELLSIIGGKYYGNGVHCNSKTCWLDQSQAWGAVGRIAVNGWVEHGPWAQG
ncbi:bacteriocin [Lactobacillus sp. CC-MHH1034]|uniref:leucocin A/sakacin P family class II bacteriocin n=1 Tax=Agrilactobacillus fermenti TaxID=2586909 RepID=UPI001E2D3148|nr:leucocin A/sakacin P family class II bacteriocin [Agrilactobacillus fermenti]MCD2255762.1 bacteriocin [Agrilactobacillus fermenti]